MDPYKQLVDLAWYSAEASQTFATHEAAVAHYLTRGEQRGYFPNPLFDARFYSERYRLAEGEGALAHFVAKGLRGKLQPNYFFHPDWYLWQNGDAKKYGHPIFHYLGPGGAEFRDPSPYVDMVQFRRKTGLNEHGARLVNRICREHYGPEAGVCRSFADLVAGEREFLDSIHFRVHKESASPKRRYLVWVQCSRGSNFFKWYRDDARNWDLLLNYYKPEPAYPPIGENIVVQNGTKFTAILNVWRYRPRLLEGYDYIFFIDDDLMFQFDQVGEFFEIISRHGIDLAQPALAAGSQCVWPVFFGRNKDHIRYTNGVEIMMPAFSRRALDLFYPYFAYSVSGFGLDLLFAKLASHAGLKSAVVDKIHVRHDSKIDQQQGAYYEFLRGFNVNSKLELWRLMEMFSLENEFYEV